MADPAKIKAFLDAVPTSVRVKAAAWDALSAPTDAEVQARLDELPLSPLVKGALWDLANETGESAQASPAQAPSIGQALLSHARTMLPGGSRGQAQRDKDADLMIGALPAIGGAIGGVAGSVGGPAAIGTAALGGAAGQAAAQFLNGLRGRGPESLPQMAGELATEGAIQGGAQAIGAGAGAAASKAAPWLMQSALKPTAAVLKEYSTTPAKLVQTLLREGVSVTEAGIQKLQALFDATNQQIGQAVKNAPGAISKQSVAARVLPTAAKQAEQVNASSALRDVGESVTEFMEHPVYSGPSLSVPEAQAMKVGTYREIGKNYGKDSFSSANIETKKALARGLKEEVADAVPEISALNARDAELMAALDATGRRVAQAGNRDPVGFAWVAQHPATFLAALFDRNPAVKSLIARGMFKAAGSAAQLPPNLIRLAVTSVAAEAPQPVGEPRRE